MTAFPSKLAFASFLQYSPRGTSETAKASRRIRTAIKQDKYLAEVSDAKRVIPFMAERIHARLDEYPFLKNCFGPNVVLVPGPRSSPLSVGALWPGKRICEALITAGLGERVDACLERVRPVQKAAFAKPGERPGPQEHYDSVVVHPQKLLAAAAEHVTLVDDVVTRGATFVGLMPHLVAAFPTAMIHCFALVRTESYKEIQQIRECIEGTISYEHGVLRREP